MEMNYYSITTDIGNRKMNEASFSENKVQLYEIAVGDGGGEPYNPTTDMMALKGEQWRGLVSKLTIEQNIATVETVIPSEIGGFTIRELAVFDIDNNMIAIGNTPETPKVSNEEGIINEMKLQMEFSLINTDVLELKTDPNILTATKADVQELKERLENPEFDDSGEVEEISSFTDFIGSVKSKMNIFQFFKNFKAGLKYIVHTGQAVNNVTTTEPGFYLDGRVGKFLQDQITEQNKNIPQVLPDSFTFFSGTINQKLNEIKNRRGYYWGYHWNEIPQPSDAPDSIANQNKGSYYEIIGNDTASRFLVRCTLQDEPYNTFERFYILDISGQFYKPLTNWSTHLTNSDLPIFQSFIVDPQGSDRIVLTLTNNADSGKVFATNGDVSAFNGYIKGVQIEHNTNKLTVFLSENRTGNIRINVMYMKL